MCALDDMTTVMLHVSAGHGTPWGHHEHTYVIALRV
jgi:hypothetical protein